MKRNLILAFVALLLASGAYWLYTHKKDTSTTINRAESNFRIENTMSIGRVILTHKDGKRSDLKRVGDYWTINDMHKVRQTNIDFLLTGIQRQELDHIPNRAASKNVMEAMSVSGIHVEIYDTGGNMLLNYYVGGVTQDERGTYFVKEGSVQPYCLNQPGFEGGLRVRYALEPVEWRDVRFWLEDLDKMDSFRVDYPQQHQHAFVITRTMSGFKVEPMYSTTPRLKGASDGLVRSYFTVLSQLACEEFINDAIEKDSILQMEPFMEMEVSYPDKKSRLRFYGIGQPVKSEFSPPISRFFIDYENRDFMLAQFNVIKEAFRSYDYFFPR